MTPGFEERLFKELGQLHGGLSAVKESMAHHERRDDERHNVLCGRLDKLEDKAENTGRHELAKTEKKLEQLEAEETARKKASRDAIRELAIKVTIALCGFIIALLVQKLGLK